MEIEASQLTEEFLLQAGEEASRLLQARKFIEVAEKFGYALAFDASPAAAIERDAEEAASRQLDPDAFPPPSFSGTKVSYFQPNGTGLRALVECSIEYNPGQRVLAELVVAENEGRLNLFLEQVS